MTPTEFRHAADRGMGRAALCLIENDPAPYLPELIETCVEGRDQDDRADYLFSLFAFAWAEAWAEDRLLARLPTLEYPSQAEHYWRVLNRFAMLDFPRSRAAVMAYALRADQGAKLVAAWGVEGLRWLMEFRPDVFEGDYKRLARDLIDAAEETSGEEVIVGALSAEVRAAREAYRSEFGAWERPDVAGLDWEAFLARIREADRQREWDLARAWAKRATPEDLRRAAEWLLTEEALSKGGLAATLFTRRPWPLDAGLIFDRLGDPVQSDGWSEILSRIDDPRIRELAFARLERENPDWGAASLMVASVQDSDADRLMRILQKVPDSTHYESHDLFLGLAEMAKRGKPGLVPVFERGMEKVFCSICRRDIAHGMARYGLLPEWLRTEAGYDVESEICRYAEDRRSPVLSAARFRRAATKGQGRAVRSAMQGPASLYAWEVRWVALFGAPMLHEEMEPRAAYVLNLAARVGMEEKILDALLEALAVDTEDEYVRDWHVALVAEYAKRGNGRAQATLPPSEEVPEEPRRRPKGLAAATAEELALRFEAETDFDSQGRESRAFGRKASEEELRLWAERILREEDADAVEAMGEAFIRRPWPLAPELVIERVEDPDRDGCIWRRMLKAMPNPEVRTFALAKLAEKEPDSDAVGYLRRSYQPGDEAAVLAALARVDVEDDQETYYFSWEVVALARIHGAERFVPHLEWVAEHSSSSRYRTGAIEQLLKVGALSDYHRQEATYDAEPETRTWVGKT